jgi:ATP-dependent RNA helicase SUPV3L1/SUV3
LPEGFYRACGFHVCGGRAVRIDILERLGDQIRPLVSWKPDGEKTEAPAGALGGGAFKVQPDMMAILGCSHEELNGVLKALGYRLERRPVTPQPAAGAASASNGAATETADGAATETADGAAANAHATASHDSPDNHANSDNEEPQADEAARAATENGARAAEPVYEEIWRPRRRPERRKRPRQQDKAAQGEPRNAPRQSRQTEGEQARGAKPANDKRGPKKKRAAHGKGQAKPAASADKKQAAVDPDSPFAALQGLKDKMERDMQERA